jgi:hypothetical protein
MKQLKVKLIVNANKDSFKCDLEEFLKTDIEGSVQYRVVAKPGGDIVHSALIIYAETPKEEEDG